MIRSTINPTRFFGLFETHFEILGSILDRKDGKSFPRISVDSFRGILALSQPEANWEAVRDNLVSYGILKANQDRTYYYLTRAVRETIMFLKDSARFMSSEALRGLATGLRRVAEEIYTSPDAVDVAAKLEQAMDNFSGFSDFVEGNIVEATRRLDAAQAVGESGGMIGWRMLRNCQESYVSPLVEIIRPSGELDVAADLLKNALARIIETSADDEVRSVAADFAENIRHFFATAPADIRSCNTRLSKAATRYMNQISQDFATMISVLSVGPAELETAKSGLMNAINLDLDILSVKVMMSPSDAEIEAAVSNYFDVANDTDKPKMVLERPESTIVNADVISLAHLMDEVSAALPIGDAFEFLAGLPEVGGFERAVAIAYGALIERAQYHTLGLSIYVDTTASEKAKELPSKTMTYTPVRIEYV